MNEVIKQLAAQAKELQRKNRAKSAGKFQAVSMLRQQEGEQKWVLMSREKIERVILPRTVEEIDANVPKNEGSVVYKYQAKFIAGESRRIFSVTGEITPPATPTGKHIFNKFRIIPQKIHN